MPLSCAGAETAGEMIRVHRGPAARRRRRRWPYILLAALALLSPALYSYTTTMMQPSSLPLGVRSVEWLRNHHANWLVDEVEHYYYSQKAPTKGGPQLKALPQLGLRSDPAASARRRHPHPHATTWPPRITPIFPHALP